MTSFGARLRAALDARGPLCVGIDPHERLLEEWGMDASAAGVREFGLRVVEAAAGRAGVVKPQVSFFERWGSAGFTALEDVLASARAAGLLVIADAKRGDIGTTMDAYARAWLTPGSPLEADALTVSPYLGVGTLTETFAYAVGNGKGVFVLAATSNPEGDVVQRALPRAGVLAGDSARSAGTVSNHVIDEVSSWSRGSTGDGDIASIGFVIGATVDWDDYGLPREIVPAAPILAPGFGAQGAAPADLLRLFGGLTPNVVASESRSILSVGPRALAATIDARADEYRRARD
ncbi:orotidine-5'-phosphate decarboxylase [Microbacterium ulmi]|uniref:Orotidine-5'-phosphate decarboxylase n=1 Tax=Microbacterium ulmi TaxID=179095 RepID=A0A7Y2Q2T0_9MICO|nr:orotidine-5'-phosphate decarboxylase [Microbacterium ulmi]NII70946.1 orotidine-5'-phosphate decarboxylase [Microbacterium ulmi]NNH05320.1 orotidine-5'-phosphate decarboxylase [Microbacterium ulmi]